jgi:hypothetical protein
MKNWLQSALKLSINPTVTNKPDNMSRLARGWKNRELKPAELAECVQHGFAYCAQLIDLDQNRSSKNFLCSDIVSVDIDKGRTLDEVRNDPLVREAATIIYTTVSHTNEAHRFRVIFALSRTITDPAEMRAATRSLRLRLRGDSSVVDPARGFCGNTNTSIEIFDRGLSSQRLQELIEQSKDALQHDRVEYNGTTSGPSTGRSSLRIASDHLLTSAANRSGVLQEFDVRTPMFCPWHHDHRPSAFVTQNQRKTAKGIHCSTCGVTYWSAEGQDEYDLWGFDELVLKTYEYAHKHRDMGPIIDSPDAIPGLVAAKIILHNDRYLPYSPIDKGMTFVKSQTGTGKTEFLSQLVATEKKRVLLIGHRRPLLQSAARRLGLHCYLDDKGVSANDWDSSRCTCPSRLTLLEEPPRHNCNYCLLHAGIPVPKEKLQERYAICLDSIAKVDLERPYDLVLIDESEQVLSHALSDTMKDRRRFGLMAFANIVSRAKRVVVLDADLGWLSWRTFTAWRTKVPHTERWGIILNQWTVSDRTISLYASRSHLIGDIHHAIERNERCFVTSNSKTAIDGLYAEIRSTVPDDRILVVTSDTSDSQVVQRFLHAVPKEARQYQVILASPSLGTGVDISFPNDEQVIDNVFGIFESNILTHFECDQQLARVRNAGSVKVYVSPATFEFESNFEVIHHDVQEGFLRDCLISGINADGKTCYDHDGPLLPLAKQVVSLQRTSKNRLRKNFVELKRRQGWHVKYVVQDDEISRFGSIKAMAGKSKHHQFIIDGILAAPTMTDAEYLECIDNLSTGAMPAEKRLSYMRTQLERFYRQPVTDELIALDQDGLMRRKLRIFAQVVNEELLELRRLSADNSPIYSRADSQLLRDEHQIVPFVADALMSAGIRMNGQWRDAEFTLTDLSDFVAFMKAHKTFFETHFKRPLNKDIDKKPVAQLKMILDLVGVKLLNPSRTQSGGTATPWRRLDFASIDAMECLLTSTSLKRWSKKPNGQAHQETNRESLRKRLFGVGGSNTAIHSSFEHRDSP